MAIATAELTLGATLQRARQQIDATDARVLLQHALGVDRSYLLTHAHEPLTAAQAARFAALLQRREAGEPVAYLTGEREFYGLQLRVTPDVLIPRPETELVVDIALAKLAGVHQPRVLDLGTGSGAIALSIAALRSDARVVAVDASTAALAVAQANTASLFGDVSRLSLRQSDWYEALGADQFDVIASNPPYVAVDDAHLAQGDLRFEPTMALIGGTDGLQAIRSIIAGAGAHLKPDGWLIFEHGYDQAERCRALLAQHGFLDVNTVLDLARIPRVTFGRLGAS